MKNAEPLDRGDAEDRRLGRGGGPLPVHTLAALKSIRAARPGGYRPCISRAAERCGAS
jgi:hypothetical protein